MKGRVWQGVKPLSIGFLTVGALILLALGAAFAEWAALRQDRWMREDLLYQTRLLAQTIHLTRVQRLHGNETDEGHAEYRRLKDQLIAAQQVNPDWKWIYLMGRRADGTVFFQVDSEAYDAPDPAPPGQPYEEASPILQGVFDSGLSADEGPIHDRWGVWVSAYVPLKDPATGTLVTVVGIDIDANLWFQRRAGAMQAPLLAGLALLAIWLGGAHLLARRARPEHCKTWFCPHIESFLAAATGLTLTVTAVWLVRQVEMHNQKIAFRHLASIETAPMFDAAISLQQLELEGFASFFENSEDVTAAEFRRYAAHLSHISEVHSWIWAEAVETTGRAPFEKEAGRRTGKPDYQIWERDAEGLPVAAGAREWLYPILFLAPRIASQPLLGFDIGSDPVRRAALEAADQTHLVAASDPISFLHAPKGGKEIFVLRPVFRANDPGRLQGFIGADLKIAPWLQASREGNLDRRPMAFLDLFQLRAGQPALALGTTAGQEEGHDLHLGDRPAGATVYPLLVFGKAYAIVAHPTPAFRSLYPPTTTWLVMLSGLVLTGAIAWVLGLFAHRREGLARLVDAQSRDLASSMRRYDQLARHSRTITWECDVDGLYTDISNVVEDVLGYAPQELVGKKHFYDLHPEAGREAERAVGRELAAERKPFLNRVNPVVAKSGDIVWMSSTGMPLLDANGNLRGYQGTAADITARKNAEDHLRFQAQLLDCVNESVVSTDLEGRIQYWNREAEKLYGYASAEVLGRPYRTVAGPIHPPDEESFRREIVARGFWRGEHLQRRKDGATFWTASFIAPVKDAHGRAIGFIGIDQDITERKRAAEALATLARQNKQAAERYATFISASNTGAWEYHDDTAYMWASPEYFAMLGRAPADFDLVDGQPNIEPVWLDLLHPDDKDRCRREFIDYMKHPAGMYQHAFRMRHANGHWVWILSRGQVLRDANGQPTSVVVGTHIDITESKRAEQALFDSEQKFRTLFEEMLEGFSVHEIICDDQGRPTDYRFLDVNPAFERLTGLKAKDILGKTALEVLPQLERRWIDDFGRVALTGEPAFLQQFAGPLGKHYEVTVFRPAPGQFASIFTDITESRRAEDELRESRRQYAGLLANLPGMAYRCANDRSWTMEFVSEGCRDLTGYAPADFVGNQTLSFNDLIRPPHRERLWEKWQAVLQKRGKFENEYEITTRAGEIKWVWEQGEGVFSADGQVVALEGFIADITERKRAGGERERITRAMEQSLEIIVITDDVGAILYVNPAFTRATGYSREQVLGKNPHILKSGQHDKAFYQKMWATLLAGQNWEGQIVNKRKDGGLYTESATISPVRDADGRVVNYVAVKRDITQELQNQVEKETIQAQLVQAQKMESIGRLAGGVAHDFNNMLQAILGYAEMAIEQVAPGLPLHSDLKEIQRAAQRSAVLTRQLQAFARRQVVAPKVLDLNEAVAGMLGMLRRLIGEEISLAWRPGPDIGPVKMDPGQLDQIVVNLCVNARDAIEKSGQIAIETSQVRLETTFHGVHGDIEPGAYAVLAIADDGRGMAPEVLDHIFEPFFTTKPSGKGTGLGLATAYGIVKQNHGGIQVRSEPGQGSSFQIFLPRHAGRALPDPTIESPAPTGRGDETILLVEDEKTILHAAGRMLESLGYPVLATSSPAEALRLADEHKDRIRLLLTDVIMPEMNGPELVRQLRQRHPGLMYLYISGYAANLIAAQGVSENSVNFIQKPFSRIALAQKVREVLDGA